MPHYEPIPAHTRLFNLAGTAIFGAGWVAPLARSISTNERTVQRWANGQNAVPPFVWPPLLKLIEGRRRHLERLKRDITLTLNTTEGTET